jgi:energy-coupling factor transporter ATP-binding protein EcfA2
MANPSNLNDILQRILDGTQTDTDVEDLRQWLNSGGVQNLQVGKYNVNIGRGKDIHIGDRIYQGIDAEAIREVVRAVIQGSNAADIRSIVKSILKEEFPNMTPPAQPQSNSPKTILVLASSPSDRARLRLDREVREIEEGLRRSQYRDRFVLQQRWAVRPEDLRRALLDFKPQIVHFSGHGEGEDGLLVENDAGLAQAIPTEDLAKLLERFAKRGLECVVLNACYSEVQANAIAEHIDFVVGMNSAIGDDAAIKFAVSFYDELGAGYSYEDAYNGGCDAIALEGIPEQHIPVFKNLRKVRSSVTTPSSLPPNPFVPLNGPVEDPAQFFEPHCVINNVFELLNSGSSVALIGERGMGKSSVLKAIERLALERLGRQAIYLNWNLIRNEDTFWELICELIGVARCHNLQLIRALQSRRLLLLLDEVERMAQQEFGAEIRSQLRGFAQDSSIKVVVTARVSLDLPNQWGKPLSSDDNFVSPFAGLCIEERIQRWSDKMIQNYIEWRLTGNHIRFTQTEIEGIIKATQGKPEQLVQCCHKLYREYRDSYGSK